MGPIEERWRDNEVEVVTWFERDRAMVGIQEVDTGEYLVDWWDDDVTDMMESGYFGRRGVKDQAVIEYADMVGLPAYPQAANPKEKLALWRLELRGEEFWPVWSKVKTGTLDKLNAWAEEQLFEFVSRPTLMFKGFYRDPDLERVEYHVGLPDHAPTEVLD